VESQALAHHALAFHAGQHQCSHQWIRGEPQKGKKASLVLCYVNTFCCIGPSLLPIEVVGSSGSRGMGFKKSYKWKKIILSDHIENIKQKNRYQIVIADKNM
jgi:hypothetical protein